MNEAPLQEGTLPAQQTRRGGAAVVEMNRAMTPPAPGPADVPANPMQLAAFATLGSLVVDANIGWQETAAL